MTSTWLGRFSRAILLGVTILASVGTSPTAVAALSLNPLDYYSYEYHIVFSHTEVEPEESFEVTAGATVRCTKDLPFGVREAAVEFTVVARDASSGNEIRLLERYDFTVSNVPDWAGDEYSTSESVDLAFPAGTAPGTYVVAAQLEHLSLDGWNVTSMVPSSARTMGLGTIVCSVADAPPTPTPPPQPGVLVVSVLGHLFRPGVDSDGILIDAVDATLIEGLLSLSMQQGTECVSDSSTPLTHLTATRDLSPVPCEGGAVLSAFVLGPEGARFSPALRLGISYVVEELPPECEEDELAIGYLDSTDETWRRIPSTVDETLHVVYADTLHFSTFGLLAPTPVPGPARFVVRTLDVTPASVPPFGRVNVVITIANTGDTEASYPLVVKIDGMQEHSQSVNLAPRESRTIRLTTTRSQPGTYQVQVGDLSRDFSVVSAATSTSPTISPEPESVNPPAESQSAELPTSSESSGGMNPVYAILLAIAAVAFVTLVVLVLAGVL